MAKNIKTIEGTETTTVNDQVQGSHDVTLNSIKNFINGNKKVYKAFMTQSGTNNPVVFVIENTLGGEIVWSRAAAGFYVGTVTGTLLTGRCNFGNGIDGAGNYILIDPGNATKTILSTNGIIGAQFITEFAVQNFTFDELSLTDGIYAEAPIFIEIYQ